MNLYKIKNLPVSERPRERLKMAGSNQLSDREVLAIILKTGTKDKSVNDLAIDVLNTYSLSELKEVSLNSLLKIKGIGEVKAIELLAAIELGKRIFLRKNNNFHTLNSPEQIFLYTKYLFFDLKQEYFYCLYFNNKQQLIGEKLLFQGTINRSLTHPREIFKEAYRLSATSIVCMHNHPSNNTTPSKEDIDFTNTLISLGQLQGIPIIDHIIVGNDNYYSFMEHSKIDFK